MQTNQQLYAVLVCTNRYGRNVLCELAEPPSDWRTPEYMQMRIVQPETGYVHVNELVHVDDAAWAWADYTGVALQLCLQPGERR
jgi:hypothetical protein